MKKLKAALIAAGLGIAVAVPLVGAQSAEAHGWVTDPGSRQELCANGSTSFDCGGIKYEPQSVEAPKGSMKCSGGNEGFEILDDESRDWPVHEIGNSIDIKWKITANHSTSTWDYFVDGELHDQYDDKGAQPDDVVTHSLTDLSEGQHTILARWNVADTANAFYSCIDVQVGEGDGSDQDGSDDNGSDEDGSDQDGSDQDGSDQDGSDEDGSDEDGTDEDGDNNNECDAPEWNEEEIYNNGDEVSYDGDLFEANWWTQGETPEDGEVWDVWVKVGSCDA